MNQLYFEGKYVDLYAEDYVYLQENIHTEYLKIIDMMILGGVGSYIVSNFILKVSTTDNTKLLVSQEGDKGVILVKSGLMIEASSDIDNITLSDSTYGVKNNIYCKCFQAYASYDMKTQTIVEARKTPDLITHSLVYNRKIDKIEIVVYTDSEYAALTQSQKDELVFLGSTIAQGSGQPLIIVDTTQVSYITARVNDHIITFEQLDPDLMFPQKMVAPTSTGSVDDHYYNIPEASNIQDNLNEIRTMLRDIKGSDYWDDTAFVVRGSIPETNTLWKQGVFLGYSGEYTTVLSSTGLVSTSSGSALIYSNIKHINNTTEIILEDNTEHLVGDLSDYSFGEVHYIGPTPNSFYLNYTSTGNVTVTELHIVRSIDPESEFVRATDPANLVSGDDYYYDELTGQVVTFYSSFMHDSFVLCTYTYKNPQINTLELTAYGLGISEGLESSKPEPVMNTSTGILVLGEITKPGLPNLPELVTVPTTSQRNELREVREILSTDLANYTSTGVFRNFPYYAVHKLSVLSSSTGVIVDKGLYWDVTTKENYDNVFSLIDTGELHTIIHTQEDDELWIETFTGSTEDVELKIEYTTSTGGFDNTIYYTIPQTSGLDYKSIVKLLHKGFEKGYHKVKIILDNVTNLWTATGALNTPRWDLAGAGTQSAALSFGGSTGSDSAVTEKFNGTSWTATSSLNTARQILAGSGIQSAALSFGGLVGLVSDVTEKFDGASWAATGSLNTARQGLAGCGVQLASLSFGGYDSIDYSAATEKFDGSTWTTSGNLNTARFGFSGCGIQSAAVSFGGNDGSYSAVTEKFNGTSWSYSGNLNTARYGLAGAGTQSAALSFGGSTGSISAVTEKFDGNSWSTSVNLNTARFSLAGAGTHSAALSFGGNAGLYPSVTEKFNTTYIDFRKFIVGKLDTYYNTTSQYIDNIQSINIQTNNIHVNTILTTSTGNLAYVNSDLVDSAHLSTDALLYTNSDYLIPSEKAEKTYTVNYVPTHIVYKRDVYTDDYINFAIGDIWSTNSSWNLNTARSALAGCGTQSAALSFGGSTGSNSAVTEKFDGSAWSYTGNLNTARLALAGAGIQNAALSFGGTTGSISAVTEKFDGSTWTTSGNLNTARFYLAGCGTQSAALSFGGYASNLSAVTEKFNGISWTASGSLNTARYILAGAGVQSAGLSFGGSTGSPLATTEKFNGSTWTTSGNLNTARYGLAGCGLQSAALSIGGTTTGSNYLATTEKFDGTSWKLTNNLNGIRRSLAGAGLQNAALSFGGVSGSGYLAVTEKLTVCTTPVTITINNPNTIFTQDLWTVTGSLNTARYFLAGCGTQSAALSFGGTTNSTDYVTTTEKFNNSTWSASSALNNARRALAGCGTQNSSLSVSGYDTTYRGYVEKFNGNSWTYSSTWNSATLRYLLIGCGIQNASVFFGGDTGSASAVAEKFNGSTWTTTGTLITARSQSGGSGLQNAALVVGGFAGTTSYSIVEKYNGLIWVASGYTLLTMYVHNSVGTQNSCLTFGGITTGSSYITTSGKFNGSSWISTSGLLTPRQALTGAGSQNLALSPGGFASGTKSALTEKFIGTLKFNYILHAYSDAGASPSTDITSTVTNSSSATIIYPPATCEVALNSIIWSDQPEQEQLISLGLSNPLNIAWTVTGSLNTPRRYLAGCGSQNSAISFGGDTGSVSSVTEVFNGSTWTPVSAGQLMTARKQLAGAGIQSAALSFGGFIATSSSVTEKFNGVWSTTGTMITAQWDHGGCGIQNAALSAGGADLVTSPHSETEKFNGSSWITNTAWNLNTARAEVATCGNQTAALCSGGGEFFLTYSSITEKFNGSTWTTSSSLNINRLYPASSGTANAALVFGGFYSFAAASSTTEMYNGAYWSISGYLNTARADLAGCGSQSASLNFGGETGSVSAVTEKYNYTINPLLPTGTRFTVDIRT